MMLLLLVYRWEPSSLTNIVVKDSWLLDDNKSIDKFSNMVNINDVSCNNSTLYKLYHIFTHCISI